MEKSYNDLNDAEQKLVNAVIDLLKDSGLSIEKAIKILQMGLDISEENASMIL